MCKYYILIANNVPCGSRELTSAYDIAESLLNNNIWTFTPSAPLRSKLFSGDKILIYLAGIGRRHFIASAVVSIPSRIIDDESVIKQLTDIGLGSMCYSIGLKNICWFDNVVDIKPIIQKLHFIRNKKYYGLHLRLPIARIDRADYEIIMKRATLK